MTVDIILPNLGFGMDEGQLVSWLKKTGDSIRKGEAVAEVESDKATVELEAVTDGILVEILVEAGVSVPVGSVLARIRPTSEQSPGKSTLSIGDTAETRRATPLAQRVAQAHGVDLNDVAGSGLKGQIRQKDVVASLGQNSQNNGADLQKHDKVLAAPAIRKLAKDLNINLAHVQGTGRVGQITRTDIEAVRSTIVNKPVLPTPIIAPSIDHVPHDTGISDDGRQEIPLSQMRKSIARRLSQSAQEAPHFYVTAELDLTPALQTLPKGVGINTLLMYLTVLTLKDVPELNATFEDGRLFQHGSVNLAIAIALENGLITPVLHHAEDYSLTGLATRSRDVIDRARSGKLRQEELTSGTFTVSNLGMVKQIERFTAIINPPQVAILAIGAAKARPFVIDGGLHIRETVHLTLSADHRIIDGLLAARFLETFDGHLRHLQKGNLA
jgi:pyruvate dehydrogenase E2 component (dihydrolipoamide acetyltransferase)